MRLEFKAIKKEGILLKIGQGVLLLSILLLLFYQLYQFKWAEYPFAWPAEFAPLGLSLLLVFLNWFFEWKKWEISLQSIGVLDLELAKQSFYAGMLSGFFTPSALGNFVGRMLIYEKEIRPKIVSHTLFANGAQFCVSFLFGSISLFILSDLPIVFKGNVIQGLVVGATILSLFLYFFIEKIPFLRKILQKYTPSFSEIATRLKLRFLQFSIFRYLIFSFQFYLIIRCFVPSSGIEIWFWIWNLYLWVTFSPSLFLGKLFIRESLAVFILTHAGIDLPIALISSLLIWIMNNIIPSLYAYYKWKRNVLVQA